jgi:methionyl-tRNA formyltransferase
MTTISKTIVFFGTDNFSLVALQGLVESGYNIAAVVTKPDSRSGRGQSIKMSAVKRYAIDQNITVWQPLKVAEINNGIISLGDNVAGVVASYGKIIPESTINLFNPGIINIHPSLLPLYRGPSPIESAIANNDSETGVCIMELVAKMDAGPIYDKVIYKLSGHETSPELYITLANLGSSTLLKLLPSILDGSLQPTEQEEDKVVYCHMLSKDDAWLKYEQINAKDAESAVRSHLIFPKTKAAIQGHTIIITKAHVSTTKKSPLDIACLDGEFLSIDQLIAPSGRTMSAQSFLSGYIND